MKSAPFDLRTPTSVTQACRMLGEHGTDATVLAGGQSLVPMLAMRSIRPKVVIDLNGVAELNSVRADPRGVTIGALARQHRVERDPAVRAELPLLCTAIGWIGHPQVRHRGTVGGSLAHAHPSAELPAVALALDATLLAVSEHGGARELTAQEFFKAPGTTALRPAELLTEVRFPRLAPGTGWAFQEVSRRKRDFALVGVAAVLRLDDQGSCAWVRVALLGVGETPIRAVSVERALRQRRPDEATITAAATAVVNDVRPPDDIQASADYRRYVATVLVGRTLAVAARRAQEKGAAGAGREEGRRADGE